MRPNKAETAVQSLSFDQESLSFLTHGILAVRLMCDLRMFVPPWQIGKNFLMLLVLVGMVATQASVVTIAQPSTSVRLCICL